MIKADRFRLSGLLAALLMAAPAMSAPAADAEHGEQLARRWCATCHVVGANQKGTVNEAPPFATIARKPDFDAARLAKFLQDPHPKMPNMELGRYEAADLAAYIRTLK